MSKLFSRKANNWLNIAQSSLFPYHCFICNQVGHNDIDLCAPCQQALTPLEHVCSNCGVALNTHNTVCGRCLKSKPHFDQVKAIYPYEGSARFLVQSLKFQSKYSCARTIGRLMAEHFRYETNKPDALLAVPLHVQRLSERGFNQSELIAQQLQQQLSIPLLSQSAKRLRNTSTQASLTAIERRRNMRKAFSYHASHTIKSIAIIDDVVTTGATANELAKTLKASGVKHVQVWAFARA